MNLVRWIKRRRFKGQQREFRRLRQTRRWYQRELGLMGRAMWLPTYLKSLITKINLREMSSNNEVPQESASHRGSEILLLRGSRRCSNSKLSSTNRHKRRCKQMLYQWEVVLEMFSQKRLTFVEAEMMGRACWWKRASLGLRVMKLILLDSQLQVFTNRSKPLGRFSQRTRPSSPFPTTQMQNQNQSQSTQESNHQQFQNPRPHLTDESPTRRPLHQVLNHKQQTKHQAAVRSSQTLV